MTQKLIERLNDAVGQLSDFVEEQDNIRGDRWYPALEAFEQAQGLDLRAEKAKILIGCEGIRGRYSHSRLFKLQSGIRNVISDIWNFRDYGTTVDLLSGSYVENYRKGRSEYGSVEKVVAKRAVLCRSCAQTIKKGETVIRAYHDFQACGSWTAVQINLHVENCENKIDAVEAARKTSV